MIIAHSSKSTFGFGTVDWGVGSNIHVDCGVLLTRRHNRKKTAKKYKTSKSCILIFVNKKLMKFRRRGNPNPVCDYSIFFEFFSFLIKNSPVNYEV